MRVLRLGHRWLGLALVLPMLLQGLTGTLLAVTPFWEAWRTPAALSGGPPHDANAQLAAARASAPAGMVPVSFRPAEAGGPAVFGFGRPGQRGAALEVLLDPGSLAVLGMRRSSATYRWVHGLHEFLLLPASGGRSVIGWFGLGLLLLGLSGVALWWPRPGRWLAAVTVRRGARGAQLQRELHGAAGFWFSLMLVLMSVSGMTMAWPRTVEALIGAPSDPPGGGPARPGVGDGHRAEPERGDEGAPHADRRGELDLDAVLRVALAAMPEATPEMARLPDGPGRPVVLRLRPAGASPGAPAAMLSVDPAGRRVLSVRDPRRLGMAALAVAWLRSLHQGDAFGAPWRMLVALTGVGLPLLAATGTTLWLLRRRNHRRLDEQRRLAVTV